MRFRLILALVAFALVAAACGSSDSDAGDATQADDEAASATDGEEQAEKEADEELDDDEPTAEPAPTAPPEPEPTATPEPDRTATPQPEPVGLELSDDGPYAVGVETIVIDEDTDRPLTVDVWFPLAEGAEGDPARYTFITGDFFESPNALAVDRSSAATDGPFPLIVYSHGSGGLRYIHSDYTEFLASHGYVVAAPDHTGNTAVEQFLGNRDETALVAVNRPNDVITVIDAMTDPADSETAGLAALVDAEQIAVTGHSMGGFTSYAVVSGYSNELGSSPADDRVDAIIPLAPAVGPAEEPTLLTDERLAAVDVPALVVVGTDDATTPVDPNVERAWAQSSSDPHYRLELVAAEHQSFTDVCVYLDAVANGQDISAPVVSILEDFGQAGCQADDMPSPRVQELTNTFVLAFLHSVFDAAEMIDPTSPAIPDDVIYDGK